MHVKHQLQRVSNQLTRLIAIRYSQSLSMYPLIEYPKSGGTWVCRMLADCLGVPFAQYARLPVAMPCVVHGHWNWHPRLENATYLIRDGRDVMVSFYFHGTRITDNPNEPKPDHWIQKMKTILGDDADLSDARANLPRYIEHLFANPMASRMNWRDHLRRWLDRPSVSYVRYEGLREDCVGAMTDLLASLGREIDHERAQHAVERYSMQRMTGRRPGQEDSSSFIRKGIVGDWKNHFTRESAQLFDDLAGDMLVACGYEPDRSWVDRCAP